MNRIVNMKEIFITAAPNVTPEIINIPGLLTLK